MNGFEIVGRARKVASIMRAVDKVVAESIAAGVVGLDSDERIAQWLTAIDRADRARITTLAGVRPASSETWTAVVAAVRARRELSEIDAVLDSVIS